MTIRWLVSTALCFCIAPTGFAQTLLRAYCGKNGRAHLLYRNGAARTPASEPKQVGCEDISIAGDQQTAGWSVLVENCCTSYPIPTSLVLYRNRKKTVISPGLMIWQWHFVGNGDRVAVLQGPVHGWASSADLYDARSGKLLSSWEGGSSAPEWANGWKNQLEPRKADTER